MDYTRYILVDCPCDDLVAGLSENRIKMDKIGPIFPKGATTEVAMSGSLPLPQIQGYLFRQNAHITYQSIRKIRKNQGFCGYDSPVRGWSSLKKASFIHLHQ